MRSVAAAVATLVLALPALGAPAPRRAALKLESLVPLTVSGRHFGAREPVLLTYLAADRPRRVVGVRAQRNGSFTSSFGVRLGRCQAFTVRADGLRGTRAVLQVEPACTNGKGRPRRALALAADRRAV